MKLDPDVFYDMSPKEFNACLYGWNATREQIQRDTYDSARLVAVACLQPHAKKGKQVKMTDVAKFPWDVKTNAKRGELMSYEQGVAVMSLIATNKPNGTK